MIEQKNFKINRNFRTKNNNKNKSKNPSVFWIKQQDGDNKRVNELEDKSINSIQSDQKRIDWKKKKNNISGSFEEPPLMEVEKD